MSERARHSAVAVVVVGTEAYLFRRYAEQGALFHFWLHALLGGYLGLAALTVHRLLRRRRARLRPWQAAFFGHQWSALPDVLFLAAGLLHVAWMDVFAAHITAHFLWPDPLAVGLGLWALAVAAHVSVVLDRPRAAGGLLLASVAALGVAVVLRDPLPRTLEQVRGAQAEAAQGVAAQAEAARGVTTQAEAAQGGAPSLAEQLRSLDWLCRAADLPRG